MLIRSDTARADFLIAAGDSGAVSAGKPHECFSLVNFAVGLAIAELGLLALCGVAADILTLEHLRIGEHGGIGGIEASLLQALAGFAVLRSLRLYSPQQLASPRSGPVWAVVGLLATAAVAVGVIHLLGVPEAGLLAWQAFWLLFAVPALAVGRHFASAYVRGLADRGLLRSRVALYSSPDRLDDAMATLRALDSELEVVAKIAAADDHDALHELIVLGQRGIMDQIVLALPSDEHRLKSVMDRLSVLPIDVYMLSGLASLVSRSRAARKLSKLAAIPLQTAPLAEHQKLLKRAFDIVIAAAALLLLSPLLAIIALAVKLDSPGPVLFFQRRHGYNHRIFRVAKFRSMSVLEDGVSVKQAERGDCRVTRVGGFLRRTSLDELPQLWNVLTGDMSLVGPRPHALAHNQKYTEIWPQYANRHRVKPGITGLAQVMGFRGETCDPRLMRRRYILDLLYTSRWSLALDVYILFKTVWIVVSRKNAF